MAVERAEVADAEVLEEGGRLEHDPERGLGAVERALEVGAHLGHAADGVLDAGLAPPVGGVGPQLREALGQA